MTNHWAKNLQIIMHSGSHFVEKNKKYKHRGKKSFRRIYSWPSISEGSTSVNSTNHGLKLNKVNSRARWHMLVIPAVWKAEAGELPELRRQRLWLAEIAPLNSSLGNKSETSSQKKKKVNIPLSNISPKEHNIWMFDFLGWYLSYFSIWILLFLY